MAVSDKERINILTQLLTGMLQRFGHPDRENRVLIATVLQLEPQPLRFRALPQGQVEIYIEMLEPEEQVIYPDEASVPEEAPPKAPASAQPRRPSSKPKAKPEPDPEDAALDDEMDQLARDMRGE